MKRTLILAFSALSISLLALLSPAAATDDSDSEPLLRAPVTAEVLESKIAEVEASTGMEEELKTKLVELYRKSLSNLQTASSNSQAAKAFQRATDTAPAEVQALREALDESNVPVPEDSLEADHSTPLRQIEQLLQKEKADLAAVDARRADFEKRLDEEANRPATIRSRLAEAKREQETVADQLKLPPPAGEGPAMSEAERWVLETRYQALSTEIKMLDQELLSQPMRVDLLKSRRDKAAASVQWVGKRVKILEELVNRKRQAEAEQAKADAAATRQGAEGKHPLVVRLAEKNAALTEEVAAMASRLAELAAQAEWADKLARQLEEDFESAQETMEIGGLSQELGHMLLQQRQSLPDLRALSRKAQEREDKAIAIGVQRLRHRQEQKQLRDLQAYVTGIAVEAADPETSELRNQLRELATERKGLLEKAVESADFHLRKLGELESAQQRLLDAIEEFDAFLDVHLLWVRSASRTQLVELGALPGQIWRIISPAGWLEVSNALTYQATRSPTYLLLAVALGALLWNRRRLIAAIRAIADKLGKPTTDRFGYSLQALALTLLLAAAWPLVMAVTGWQLKVSIEGTDFTNAVGSALLAVAAQFFYLLAFRHTCMPEGLAAAHFRWPESSRQILRSALTRLTWVYLPAAMVLYVAFHLDPLNLGWAFGRTAYVIMVVALALAFYRLLHPKSGALAPYLGRPENGRVRRLHRIWYPLLVTSPLVLGVLSLLGYTHTAGFLLSRMVVTAWMVVGLVLLHALAQRWLLVTRRRLAYQAAMERHQAALGEKEEQEKAQQGEEASPMEFEEPEVDLAALSDTSRKLLNIALIASGLIGLWMIWAEVFPALRIFEDVTLWHQTVTVDGEEQRRPITLAHLGLALLYGVATVVLAKQLPAVLEMMLLHRFDMSAGSRYTVTTLSNYAIIAIGLLLVLNTIGAQWSQLQWLVAALGVGIGFGLQEIVANFISGLIILFERPIRVGDVVSVGDTDGVVTKIRIRATTIRNWDRKELLVPNKEFVTGRLLNWSLSDKMTRIVIVVGVAYGSDVEKALALMREAAEEHEQVLDEPAPVLSFEGFGDNSLTLILRAYLSSIDFRIPTITDLHKAINRKFERAGIIIAFPQRDLHLDTRAPLRVSIEDTRQDKPEGRDS